MELLAFLLAAAAYGCFWAGAPGRQAAGPLMPPRAAKLGGAALTLAAMVVSAIAYGHGAGPLVVLTVMMATASALAVAGPFVLPRLRRRTPSSNGRNAAR